MIGQFENKFPSHHNDCDFIVPPAGLVEILVYITQRRIMSLVSKTQDEALLLSGYYGHWLVVVNLQTPRLRYMFDYQDPELVSSRLVDGPAEIKRL